MTTLGGSRSTGKSTQKEIRTHHPSVMQITGSQGCSELSVLNLLDWTRPSIELTVICITERSCNIRLVSSSRVNQSCFHLVKGGGHPLYVAD